MTSPAPLAPSPDTAPAEPLLSVGGLAALATAIVGLVVMFGLPVTGDQQAAILGVVGTLAPVVVALWGRQRVFSPATVARLLAAAKR